MHGLMREGRQEPVLYSTRDAQKFWWRLYAANQTAPLRRKFTGAVLHYFWLVKRDVSEPTLYALILAVLLCAWFGDRRKKRPAPAAAARHGIAPSA